MAEMEAHDSSLPPTALQAGPVAARQAALDRPESRIGPYRLLERLGEGGMGTVWLAEQEEPIRRQVALKIIKAEVDSSQSTSRFEAERQALALMDHPNIAKVLDAGTTGAGRPFFVMELVKGLPITDYCDQNRLGLRDRLELFMAVCAAIQHAHHKGVLHRDIKPANVLVTLQDGQPMSKVIDFGIAKALNQPLTDEPLRTHFGEVLGTIEYMSPEQAELGRLDIDTRSDVYSLGVLLYELMTGSTPLQRDTLRGVSFPAVLRRIREEEPPRPSDRLRHTGDTLPVLSGQRRTEPTRLVQQLRGDLDWIVLKALEKDRTRRYEGPGALAADLRRYLQDEPVEARPPSATYKLAKLARKHRQGLAVIVGCVVVLCLSAAISTWQAVRATLAERQVRAERDRAVAAEQRAEAEAKRAQAEADVAKAVSDFLREDFLAQASPAHEPDRDLKLRTAVDRAADKLASRFAQQPQVEQALRQTFGVTYLELGVYPAAQLHLERSLELARRDKGNESPETLKALIWLGKAHQDQGRFREAKALFEQALSLSLRVQGEEGDQTCSARANLGALYLMQSDYDKAEPLLTRALESSRRTLGDTHGRTLSLVNNLALVYEFQGKSKEAERMLLEVVESDRRIFGDKNPKTLVALNNLGMHYNRCRRYADAEPILTQVLALHRQVEGEDHPLTLVTMSNLASTYCGQRRYAEAEPLLVKAATGLSQAGGIDHPQTCKVRERLAVFYEERGKPAQAEPIRRDLVASARRRLGDQHPDLASALADLGANLLRQKKFADAEPPLREALQIRQAILGDDWRTYHAQSLLGASLAGQKNYGEAEKHLLAAWEGLHAQEKTSSPTQRKRLNDTSQRLVNLYEAWQKPELTEQWRSKRISAPSEKAKP